MTRETHSRDTILVCMVLLAVAGGDCWAFRHLVFPDGISYLDLGSTLTAHGWTAAANAYWSPLYTWIVGGALQIASPSRADELEVVQAINFLIFAATLFWFSRLVRELELRTALATRRRGERRALVLFAYSLFAWAALYEIKVTNVSPDMIVAGATFAVATLSLRSSAPRLSARREVAFGVALAVGCLAKAAFLPVAVVWLVSRMLLGQRTRAQRLAGIPIAGATLATLIVPYFATLSVKEGHLTTGASGGINYAWAVDRVPEFLNWHPSNDDFGFPRHPTDELRSEPPAYSYNRSGSGARPRPSGGGEHPRLVRPVVWFAGVQPRFELGGQIRVLVTNLSVYAKILFASPLILALLLLGGPSAYARRVGRFPEVAVSLRMRLTRPGATLFIAPTAALFIYGVVHVLPGMSRRSSA